MIFTTKGYQQGAETYAKSKNIDIFVVRDLLDEEWGEPGRNLLLYLNVISGQMSKVYFPDARAMLIVQEQPKEFNIEIQLNKENTEDDQYLLYSVKNGDTGVNLISVLSEIHSAITKNINVIVGFKDEFLNHKLIIKSDVVVDFAEYEFKQFRNKFAAINLTKMVFNFVTQISRSELNMDRADNLDYALIVQNYVSDQCHYVSKRKDDDGLTLYAYEKPNQEVVDNEDKFVNGSTLNVFTGPWVGIDIPSSTRVGESSPIHLKLEKDGSSLGFKLVFL